MRKITQLEQCLPGICGALAQSSVHIQYIEPNTHTLTPSSNTTARCLSLKTKAICREEQSVLEIILVCANIPRKEMAWCTN